MKHTRPGGDHEKRFPGVEALTPCQRCDHPACEHGGQCRHPWEAHLLKPGEDWCKCPGFVAPYNGPMETLCLACGRYQAEQPCKCAGAYVDVPARPKAPPGPPPAWSSLMGDAKLDVQTTKAIDAEAFLVALLEVGGPQMQLMFQAAKERIRKQGQDAFLNKHLEKLPGFQRREAYSPPRPEEQGWGGVPEGYRPSSWEAAAEPRNNPVPENHPKRGRFQEHLEATLSFDKNNPR